MSSRNEQLPVTPLRFVAAAVVVILHFGREAPSLRWAHRILDHGDLAVSFFFTLSGFVLAHAYRGGVRSVRGFYVARFARVAPLYFLALAATVPYALRAGACDPRALVLSALMLQSWIPGWARQLNWPGWSLSVELAFYLAFPFLFARIRRMRSPRVVALAIGAWLAGAALKACLLALHPAADSALEDFALLHPVVHFGTFVFGVCGGVLYDRGWRASPRGAISSAAVMLAVVLYGNEASLRLAQSGLFAPFFTVIIWVAAARGRAAPLPTLLGEASYGLYILHVPVALWCGAFRRHEHPDLFFWSLFIVTVGVSVATYKLVEIPAREMIKRAMSSTAAVACKASLTS